MHVPLAVVPHHRLGPLPVPLVALNVDPEAPVHLEPQKDLVVDRVPPPRGLVALDPLQLQLLQPGVEVRGLLREPLGLHLRIARGLGRPELLGVQPRDLGGVVGGRVRRGEVLVLGCEGVELPVELLERRLLVPEVQVPGLLERGQRFADSRHCESVLVDVEVVDCGVDELLETKSVLSR